jgi:hypothetical protein
MEFDTQVKLAVYSHFAETGRRPSPREVAGRVRSDVKVCSTPTGGFALKGCLFSRPMARQSAWPLRFQVFRHSTSWKPAESSISPIVPGMPWVCLRHYTNQVRFTPVASNPASLFT